MMMDTYEVGRSTTSSSSDALHREAVDSCTLSFQGYFSISALFEAINDHAVRHAGVSVDLQRLSGLARYRYERVVTQSLIKYL